MGVSMQQARADKAKRRCRGPRWVIFALGPLVPGSLRLALRIRSHPHVRSSDMAVPNFREDSGGAGATARGSLGRE